MKYFATLGILLVFLVTISVDARPASGKKTIEELVGSMGQAFAGKTLASLDADKPYVGSVTVVIQHSLGGKATTKSFKSFADVDKWLKSREKEDMPNRNSNPLKSCKSGACSYDVSSLLHNNLYIKKVTYTSSKGKFYIKTVTLLDGD